MTSHITSALLDLRKQSPARFIEAMQRVGAERSPVELNIPDIARLSWEERPSTEPGTRVFATKDLVLVLEQQGDNYVVRQLGRLQ